MFAAQSISALGVNWYDFVVLVVLLFGLGCGVRAGLSSELISTLGLLLVLLLAPNCYPPVGEWIRNHSRFPAEPANLLAFVAIAVVIYGLTVVLREFTRRRRQRRAWPALIETIGGGLAGILRLAVFMTCVTILLCLLRSSFWHQQVARNSRFGAFVVEHVPALARIVGKQFPEKVWFLDDIPRREAPTIESN